MHLIVGLGNPGPSYQFNRHNIGFMVVDLFLQRHGRPSEKSDFNALISKFKLQGQEVITCKPQTFMNRSGEAVLPLLAFYKIPPTNLIVVHDEIDQIFGQLKINQSRGHGGHNGIRDISGKIGNDYSRLRVGVGRPIPPMAVADFVLQNFSNSEAKDLPEYLNICVDALEMFLFEGSQKAASLFNRQVLKIT